MKNVINLCLLALLYIMAALPVIMAPDIAEAQAQPDTLSIESAQCFRHLMEDDDLLIVVHYDIEYASVPSTPASERFLVRLMNSGTQLGIDTPYPYGDQYGYNQGAASFYWAASGSPPAWGGEYDIVLQGNPLIWGDADDWKQTYTLTTADWEDATTQTEQRYAARLYLLDIATDIQIDWNETLVVTSVTGDVLNDVGAAYFANVIPGLYYMVPDVFSISDEWPVWESVEWTRDYDKSLRTELDGSPIGDLVEWIARNTNLTFIAAGGFVVMVFYIIAIALTVTRADGDAGDGMLVGFPVIIMGVRLGLVPMAAYGIFILTCVLLLAYILFFRHG